MEINFSTFFLRYSGVKLFTYLPNISAYLSPRLMHIDWVLLLLGLVFFYQELFLSTNKQIRMNVRVVISKYLSKRGKYYK